jgi:hypothetical protein
MPAAERSWASDYANALLRRLGAARRVAQHAELHPALRWAHSGCMALTGEAAAEPQMLPVPIASYADGVLAALAALEPAHALDEIDAAALLGERAALAKLQRAGSVSAGGACRLLPARGGWLAVSLARAHDWELLPAWLERGVLGNWADVAAAVAARGVAECVDRGRLLGLAVAPVVGAARAPVPPAWCGEFHRAKPAPARRARTPRVIDLSSLWAGPLCGHLLALLGAQVIKVESRTRPDGLRQEGSGLFDLLNADKASVALDFADHEARLQLHRLLRSADIVIEASRPRALRQLGIVAEQILDETPGLTWVALSGYGRAEPQANWTALGDDAGVAAGLTRILWECSGRLMFCADAIADPLTGLHAALAGLSSFREGGGRGLEVSLTGVIAHGIDFAATGSATDWRTCAAGWRSGVASGEIRAPRARSSTRRARALGADTERVLSSLNA